VTTPSWASRCIRRGSAVRSRLVADASGAPVLPDQGPDRPAGHGKADENLGVATHQRNRLGWRRGTDLLDVM
jgi:hypothetical protein